MPGALDDIIHDGRKYLPTVGRVLLTMTFIEDAFRIFFNWGSQVRFLTDVCHVPFPYFVASFLILCCVLSQAVGAFLLIVNKHIKIGSCLLLGFMAFLVTVYGFGIPEDAHSEGRIIFFVRTLAIVGGLLMLIADDAIRKARSSDFAGVPVAEPLKFAHTLQATGRVLLAVRCVQFFTYGYVFGAVGCVASILTIVGYKSKYSSLMLALLVSGISIVGDLFFRSGRMSFDAIRYMMFQDLSILGGLILLVCLGPGGLSIDAKKSL